MNLVGSSKAPKHFHRAKVEIAGSGIPRAIWTALDNHWMNPLLEQQEREGQASSPSAHNQYGDLF